MEFSAKRPKAVEKIVSDKEPLLAFYDHSAEHWRHPALPTRQGRSSRRCGRGRTLPRGRARGRRSWR